MSSSEGSADEGGSDVPSPESSAEEAEDRGATAGAAGPTDMGTELAVRGGMPVAAASRSRSRGGVERTRRKRRHRNGASAAPAFLEGPPGAAGFDALRDRLANLERSRSGAARSH